MKSFWRTLVASETCKAELEEGTATAFVSKMFLEVHDKLQQVVLGEINKSPQISNGEYSVLMIIPTQ